MKNSVKAPKAFLGLCALVALVGCGKQRGALESNHSQTGIIGGKAAAAGSLIANTTVGLYDTKIGAACTASILSDKFLLTAAHCVSSSNAVNLRVIFGLKMTSKGTVVRKVSGFKFHKRWLTAGSAETKNLGDIAIVKFEGGLPKGYRAARLLKDASLIKDGVSVGLAGYGHTNGVAKTGSGTLRYVVVKIENAAFSATEVMLDQTKGKGACQGDSGGPAYIIDRDGKLSLFGVTSRGEDDLFDTCGVKAVYTNVVAHKNWMKAAITALNSPTQALQADNALGDEAVVASLN